MSTNYTLNKVCGMLDRKIHPSFLKMLCDQNQVEHSRVPAYNGTRSDLYLIPEEEIEHIRQILFEGSNKAEHDLTSIEVKKEPESEEPKEEATESEPVKEEKWLTPQEAIDVIGCSIANMYVLRKKGSLDFKQGKNEHGQDCFLYSEDSVLAYAEKFEKKKKNIVIAKAEKLSITNGELIPEDEDLGEERDSAHEELIRLNEEIEKLKHDNELLNIEIERKDVDNENLKKSISAKDKTINYFKDLNDRIEVYKKENEQLRKDNALLGDRFKRLNDRLDNSSYKDGYSQCKKDMMLFLMDSSSNGDGYAQCKKDIMMFLMDMEEKENR